MTGTVFLGLRETHGRVSSDPLPNWRSLRDEYGSDAYDHFVVVQMQESEAPPEESAQWLAAQLLGIHESDFQHRQEFLCDETCTSTFWVTQTAKVTVFAGKSNNSASDVEHVTKCLLSTVNQGLREVRSESLERCLASALATYTSNFLAALNIQIVDETAACLKDPETLLSGALQKLMDRKREVTAWLDEARGVTSGLLVGQLESTLRNIEAELQAINLHLLYVTATQSERSAELHRQDVRERDDVSSARELEMRNRDTKIALWAVALAVPVMWLSFWGSNSAPPIHWSVVVVVALLIVVVGGGMIILYHRKEVRRHE